MENGISLLRATENLCLLDKHYILFRNSKSFDSEVGKLTYKYNYVTLKMQLEVDKMQCEIERLKAEITRINALNGKLK